MTVLTIAHRIQTIIDYNRVLVLDKGLYGFPPYHRDATTSTATEVANVCLVCVVCCVCLCVCACVCGVCCVCRVFSNAGWWSMRIRASCCRTRDPCSIRWYTPRAPPTTEHTLESVPSMVMPSSSTPLPFLSFSLLAWLLLFVVLV